MKILFLGTGAADWKISERREEQFFRRLSSILVDDSLLIDPGPDLFDYREKENCPGEFINITDILITHSHGDHLSIENVRHLSEGKHIRIWCNSSCAELLMGVASDITELNAGGVYRIGEYTVTPILANHSTAISGERPLLFIIENKAGRCIYYGLDTAWLPCESWQIMRKKKYDALIMEITLGDGIGDRRVFEHTNIHMAELMLETMKTQQILKSDCLIIGSHFLRYAHQEHNLLCERLKSFGVTAAYDGLEVTI